MNIQNVRYLQQACQRPKFCPPDEWKYFGSRLAALAEISEGTDVLDVGTGPCSVLIPALAYNGKERLGIGIDIDWFQHATPKILDHSLQPYA